MLERPVLLPLSIALATSFRSVTPSISTSPSSPPETPLLPLPLSQVDGGETYSEPSAVMTGTPEGLEDVPLRVHDACFTSEVLGSLKCDCAEQLQLALAHIQSKGTGIVIYLQQEGRGIGLANKIAAYALQEQKGLDTVDANRALGLPDDCREYTSVATILSGLKVKSVRLMTNNPRKVRLLQELGVRVTGRIPCLVQAQEFSARYLQTKGEKMDHIFGSSLEASVSADGSFTSSSSSSPLAAAAAISPTAVSDAAAKVTLEAENLFSKGPLSSDDMDGSFCEWDHGGGGVIEAAAGGDGTLTAAAAAVVSSSSSSSSSSSAAAAPPSSSPSVSSSSSSSSSSSGPSSTVQPLHGRMSRRQSPLVRPKRGGGSGGEKGGK